MSSNDRAGAVGLKRLSLTPGARASPPSYTPNAAGVTTGPPLPSPSPLEVNKRRHTPKRTSSISYYNSAHILSSPTSPPSDTFVRSPLPLAIQESPPVDFDASSTGLRRASSLPRRGRTALFIDSTKETTSDFVIPAQSSTTPQTLVEKHADLLSFIAKKESKCMELREQLAQQETELASLKRKWERIVSRAASNIPIVSPSDTSPSPNTPLKPLPASSGTEAVSDVVGAIRDGVTGLGRMLAMGGLHTPQTPSSPPESPASISTHARLVTRSSSSVHAPALESSSSRASSVSPPGSTVSTGRTSLSSVTSLASEDAEQGDICGDASLPESMNTLILETQNISPPLPSSPAMGQKLDKPSVLSLKIRDRKMKSLSLSTSKPLSCRSSSNLADRLTEKKFSARLASPPPSSSSSSWVPSSLNKRLEGLQKSEAITKTSKRASMLLSDVAGASSSFLGSLTGTLTTPSTPLNSETRRDSTTQQNNKPPKYFPLVAVESPTKCDRAPCSPSILDEGNDDQLIQSESGPPGSSRLAPPLSPGKPMTTGAVKPPASKGNTGLLDDDDEWNW